MKWLQNLKTNLKKKRSQGEVVEASAEQDASAKLVVPLPCFGVGGSSDADGDADLADLASKPKRRSVSVDLYGTHAEQLLLGASDRRGSVDVRASVDIVASSHRRASVERRASLEQWHEARRQRNSMDAQGTISTDKLTICKAAGTTIVNRTYITIKHLGSGTFGRVMLCFNVYDHRLYAIKFCRKSQFVQTMSRYGSSGRLRRGGAAAAAAGGGGGGPLGSPVGSFSAPTGNGRCVTSAAAGTAVPAGPAGPAAGSASGPLPPLCPNGASGGAAAGACSGRGALLLEAQVNGGSSGGSNGSNNSTTMNLAGAMQQQQQQQGQQPLSPPAAGLPRPGSANGVAGCNWDSTAPGGNARLRHHAAQQQQQLQAAFGGAFGGSWGVSSGGRGSAFAGGGFGAAAVGVPPPPPALEDSVMGAADGLGMARDAINSSGGWGVASTGPNAWGAASTGFNGGCGALDSSGSQGTGRGYMLSSGMSTGVGGGGAGAMPWGGGGSFGGSVFQEALARFQTEEVVKEIAILKKLSHPNIVNLIEVIDDPTTDSLLLVMEYVEGGTLQPREVGKGRWHPVPDSTVWKYVRQVLQGLDYLHANRVVHGDLKPANLLLDSNSRRIKIADFGSSIMAGGGDRAFSARNCAGFSTPAFRSPESLVSGYQPSFEMDIWALGVCVYMWVFGELPFTGAAPFIIYDKIRSQEVDLPMPRLAPGQPPPSRELLDFLGQLLHKDALQRLDVAAAMRHPWVTRGGTAPLPSLSSRDPNGVPAVRPSQEEIDGAIRLSDGPIRERVEAVFAERRYEDGEVLVAPGDCADTVFLIAAGEVEIVAPPLLGGGGAHEPLISGFELEDGMGGLAPEGEGGADADFLEAEQGLLAHKMANGNAGDDARASVALLGELLAGAAPRREGSPGVGCGGCGDCAATAAALQPGGREQQQQQQHQQQHQQQAAWDDEKQMLAIKGPGDSLGLPSLLQSRGQDHRWRAFCRARGEVTVFAARVRDLQQLVVQHPEMEPAVQQIATQQETDMAVAEAMRRLRIYNGCGAGGGAGAGAMAMAQAAGGGKVHAVLATGS